MTSAQLATDSSDAPAPAPAPTTAEEKRLEGLIRERFDALMRRYPNLATYLGIGDYDHLLSDGSREAILSWLDETRQFIGRVESIADEELAPYYSIERDLALYVARREVFDDDVHRVWERRVSATDDIGDGIFLLFARATRPLAERLPQIASRLEAAPRHIEEQKTRLGKQPPVRLWNELELDAARSLPSLFEEVLAAARQELGEGHAEVARLEKAAATASQAIEAYSAWLRPRLDGANDDFALGADKYAELIRLREFDGLDTDAILAIGEEQLELNRDARRRLASEIDAGASEQEVVDRVKSDHPAEFEAALDGYRLAMDEARSFVIDHRIASLPAGESLSVISTPEYLRHVMPFAAYFAPPKYGNDKRRQGIYIVTPSVDGDPGAMREHNWASIYNTSIHEAYPGHHQQLTTAIGHPSIVRSLVDAPEFVEGWGMYCEQMMREEGFDTAPSHQLMMYTDAVWRACRIILDVKLHRGEIGVADAIDFLADQTGFERPNAAAEVNRYTYTPTYQLSYLLGKVLLLRLRDDERRRLADRFSLGAFHDSLLREGSLPISFHRRLLAANGA